MCRVLIVAVHLAVRFVTRKSSAIAWSAFLPRVVLFCGSIDHFVFGNPILKLHYRSLQHTSKTFFHTKAPLSSIITVPLFLTRRTEYSVEWLITWNDCGRPPACDCLVTVSYNFLHLLFVISFLVCDLMMMMMLSMSIYSTIFQIRWFRRYWHSKFQRAYPKSIGRPKAYLVSEQQ